MTAAHADLDEAAATSPRRLTTGTLVAACLAVSLGQVALAIPAVLNGLFQTDLVPSASQLTWISDAFLVPVTLLELTFGVLGDLFGRKRLLVGGAGLLAVGEAVSVLTPGVGSATDTRVAVLWAGQILSGIGAAALFPTSLAMIAAGTHVARDRARGIAIWAGSLSIGGAISPVLGGLVADKKFGSDASAGWRWAFIAVAVLAVLVAVTAAVLAQDSSAPAGRSLDWPGQVAIAVAVFAGLFAVIQGPTAGWKSGEVIGGFVLAVLALAAFAFVELRTEQPLLRLQLFANRPFAVASVATVLGMFAFLGTAYSVSIRLTAIQGFTPLRASLAFLLLQGMALLLAPLTGRAIESYDARWAMGGGFALIAAGDYWFATVGIDQVTIAAIVGPALLVGIGFAFAVSSLSAVAVNTVPSGLAGMASGTTSLLRDFGFTLGPAVIGAVALSRATSDIAHRVATTPALQQALQSFYGSVSSAPPAQRGSVAAAVGAVRSGNPLAQNGPPATITAGGKSVPFNPLKDVAFHALGHAYSLGFVIVAVAATVAALLALLVLGARSDEQVEAPEHAAVA